MAKINSKRKGSRFELYAAKLLSIITKEKWHRVGVSSGARATTQGIDVFRGDIFSESISFKNIVVECKATKGRITLEDLKNKKSKFWKWIMQVEEESKGKKWVLIFKANNGHVFFLSKYKIKNLTDRLNPLLKIEGYCVYTF